MELSGYLSSLLLLVIALLDCTEANFITMEQAVEKCGGELWCFYFNEDYKTCNLPDCDFLFTAAWKQADADLFDRNQRHGVTLGMTGKIHGWLGFGVSNNTLMSGTSVMMCRRDPHSSLVSTPIYHIAADRRRLDATYFEQRIADGFDTLDDPGFSDDEYIHCQIRVPTSPEIFRDSRWIDLSEERYLIFAYGNISETRPYDILKHSVKPKTTPRKLDLSGTPQSWNMGSGGGSSQSAAIINKSSLAVFVAISTVLLRLY